MKKFLLFACMLTLGLTAFAQNPYAYNASTGAVSDQALPVNYTLNAAAVSVIVDFIDANGAVAMSAELGEEFLTAGEHAANVSIEGLDPGTYSLAIRVKGAALEAPVQCDPVYTFWSPYGIAVDNDPMSKHFGRVLVTECQPSVNGKGSTTAYWTSNQHSGVGVGLYEFDPQLNRLQNPEGTYGYAVPWIQENFAYADYTGGTGNNFALKKVKISKDGRIFVGGLDVKNGQPLCEVNPDNLAEWTPIFVGEQSNYEATGYDCNLYDADGAFVAGYSVCLAVTGEGENLKIMNHSSTRGQVFTYGYYKMFEYPIGTATTWDAAAAETNEVTPLSGQYTISAQNVSIDYDPNGNLWYTQYRGSPTEAQPTMKHVSKNSEGLWVEDYSFVTDPDNGFPYNRGGGIACSPDGTKLAFSTGDYKLTVADVTYDESGAPTIDMTTAFTVTSTDVRGFNDIAWDYAGNLYSCDNGKETFRRFAFPRTSSAKEGDPNEVSTPLRPEFDLTISTPTSITDMNVNKAIASVGYVNINGQVSSTPFKGVNIVVTRYADGSKSVTKLVK